MPAMAKIPPRYPDIKVEVMIDFGLTNIVAAHTMPGSGRANWWLRT